MTVALTMSDLHLILRGKHQERELLHGIDLELERGKIHGLAGESGSGKTMTALSILGLVPSYAQVTGSILLNPVEGEGEALQLVGADRRTMTTIRGQRVAMVFQDPLTSLHPQLTVARQLTDHLRYHLHVNKADALAQAVELLERVSIPEPQKALRKYPHQFSGGQRQRVAIAIALACHPDVLLADEPTTALDVTVQAGILRLLRDLVEASNLAVLLVTHDLGVMSAVADRVSVMQNGSVVESAPRQQLFAHPRHPYTRELLSALPGSALDEETTDEH